jgi:hypothetical protein
MDYTLFEEELVDYLCRMHHEYAVARSRAAAIIRIAQGCDEQIVGGDRGLEMTCGNLLPLAPLAQDPFSSFDEGALACETVRRFLEEKGGRA